MTKYWVGGSGNSNDTAHWSASSGGAGGDGVPTASDDVIFDTASSTAEAAYTFTVNATFTCLDFTMDGPSATDATKVTWAGTSDMAISGSLNLVGGTAGITNNYTGSIVFNAASGTKTISFNGLFCAGNLAFNGAGATFQLSNTLYFSNAKVLTLLAGTFDANGQLVHFAGTGGGINGAFTGSSSFYDLRRQGTAIKTGNLDIYTNITVTHTLTIDGNSATNRTLINSSVIGTPRTIDITGTTGNSFSNVDFKDITMVTGGADLDLSAIAGGSGNCGGNTGITFTTADTWYWYADTGSFSSQLLWFTATGGAGTRIDSDARNAKVILPQDTLVFDDLSFTAGSKTVTQNMPRIGTTTWLGDDGAHAVTNVPTFTTSTAASVFGSLTLANSTLMTLTASTQTYTFEGRAAGMPGGGWTITSGTGNTWAKNPTLNAYDGTYVFSDDVVTTGTISHLSGHWVFDNRNITANAYTTNIAGLPKSSSSIGMNMNLTGTGNIFFFNIGLSSADFTSSTIKFTNTSNSAIGTAFGAWTYNLIWFDRGASTASNTIGTGSFTIGELKDTGTAAHSILFTAARTYHITTFTVNGTAGNLITLNSTTTGVYYLIKDGGGTVSCNYLDIYHCVATPELTWYANTTSVDHQATASAGSGWYFTGYERAYSDSIDISESVAREVEYRLPLAEALLMSELTTRSPSLNKSDTISFVEAEVVLYTLNLSDSIIISENVANLTSGRVSDVIGITDSFARTVEYKPSPSDTITFSDSLGKSISLVLADTHSIAEVSTRSIRKIASDNQIITEAVANQITFGLSDSQSITESVTTVKEYYLSLSDTQIISESLVVIRGQFTVLSDSQSIAESMANSAGKGVSDSQAILETLANQSALGISDTISISESTAKRVIKPNLTASISFASAIPVKLFGKKPVDSIILSDSSAEQLNLKLILGDSIILSETFSTKVVKGLSISFDLFDQITKSVTISFTETLATAEALANQQTLSLSDAISIAESEIEATNPKLTDSITFAESLVTTLIKNVSDSQSITEASVKDLIKLFTETVSIVEQVANVQTLAHSDSISISEALVKAWVVSRSLADSQSVAEAETKTIVKAIIDSIDFSDSDMKKRVRFIADSVTTTDEELAKTIVKNLSDSESMTDSEGTTISMPLSDSVLITEAPVAVMVHRRFLDDSVSFSEVKVLAVGVFKTEAEPISENVANSYTLGISDSITIIESETETTGGGLSDSITITETITKKAFVKTLSESLAIADGSAEEANFYITPSDAISLAETSIRGLVKPFTESVSIAETLDFKTITKDYTETLDISETFARAVEFYLSLTESVSISDAEVIEHGISFADSITITESITEKSYVANKTESVSISEDYDLDKHPQERIGQMGYLRTIHM